MRNLRLQFIMSVSIISVLLITGCKKSDINTDKNLDASEVAMASVGAGNQRASGGGTTEEYGAITTFTFNAVKKSDGSVTGKLIEHIRGLDLSIHLDINCLTIVGTNTAYMSGIITKITGNPPYFVTLGGVAYFSVVDNGEGNSEKPDLMSNLFVPYPSGILDCKIRERLLHIPLSGNFQVEP